MLKRFLLLPLTLPLFYVASCQPKAEEEDGALLPDLEVDLRVEDLEYRLSVLQQQLADEQNRRLEQASEQASLLETMKGLLLEKTEELEALPKVEPSPSPALTVNLAEVEEEARRMARLEAQGEKHAVFTTVSGQSFKEVVISRVTDIGVVFRHSSGVARVPFSDLSGAWQERFYYDLDRALLAQKHEKLALIRSDRAAALQAANLKEQKQKDADLEALARELDELKKRERAPEVVVQEEIIVHPPIIIGNQRGRIPNGPLVKPSVIRTPEGTIPTIRDQDVRPASRPSKPTRPTTSRPTTNPRPTSSVRPTKPTTNPRPTPTSRPTTNPRPTPAVRPTKPSTSRPTPVQPASRTVIPRK